MNANRIQELAEQATIKTSYQYLALGNRVATETKEVFDKEKFAELIIAECAKLCEPAAQPEQETVAVDPLREYLENIAVPNGWDESDGEGVYEYLQRKSYQAGHNAGVAHHKQAMGERVLIGWTPQELRQIKGMAHETQDVYRAMQAKIYEYERILREKNKEIAALNKTQLDQALERNFCPRCGKRLLGPLGPVSIHTCCPPNARTFDDYGNKIV